MFSVKFKRLNYFVAIFIVFYVYYLWTLNTYNARLLQEKIDFDMMSPQQSSSVSWMDTGEYILNSENCRIPAVFPFHPSVKDTIEFRPPISCSVETPMLTYIEKFVHVTVNRSALRHYGQVKYCKYYQVFRPSLGDDDVFNISTVGVRFVNSAFVTFDFIMVQCFNLQDKSVYKHYHALIQPKYQKQKESKVQESKPRKPNILMVGIDSVSRLNFLRLMPETRRVLLHELKAFDLKGFNKVADNTLVNILPMTTGSFMHELDVKRGIQSGKLIFDDVPFMWKEFKNMGYTTLLAEDCPLVSMFNYFKEGFNQVPTDYYIRPFMLAINEERRMWSQDHKCFMDKPDSEIILNWLLDFQRYHKKKQQPYFAFTFLGRFSHDDTNGASEIDILYQIFMQTLIREGLLDNTILLFFSDHGSRYGTTAHTSMRQFEARLPFFFILPPRHLLTGEESQNLKINQNRLTTFFDIHSTLWHLIKGTNAKQGKHGQSLLHEVPHGRSCQDASIPSFWCACVRNYANAFTKKDLISFEAAKVTINYINTLLQSHTNLCRKVSVKSVIDFTYIGEEFDLDSGNVIQLYRLILDVLPGGVTYATEVKIDTALNQPQCCEFENILRISKYQFEGECIRDGSLDKYCYCLDFDPSQGIVDKYLL